jgi:glycosyltransferase involved in cell wall biosynthesis
MPTEKPRVLHVIARFNVGGTAKYLDNLIPGLQENFKTLLAVGQVQEHEIEDPRLENFNYVRIENLGRKINPAQDLRAYLELRRAVKHFNPQIIHSHTFKAGVLARLMFFRIPKVHTYHGHLLSDPEFSRPARKVIVNIERCLAKVSKILITVGEQVSKDLLQNGVGHPGQYTSIISEGRSLHFLSRDEAREKLNINANAPVVLWMARMAPVKNPVLALEVCHLLPGFTFIFAGNGKLLSQIKEQAPPNAMFLSWVDPAEVLPTADIFFSTSLNEGVPYSILEALSAGVPVVAVKSGSIKEILDPGINGIFTSQDPLEIATLISGLYSNLQLRLNWRQSVLNSGSTNEILNKMAMAHLVLYKKVLGS